MKELVGFLSPYDMKSIMGWAKGQLRDQRIKQCAKIAVWVESIEEIQAAEIELKDWGFRYVKAYLPEEDSLPNTDLLMFYRTGKAPDGGWKKLSDAFVKHTLDNHREDNTKVFFYYGPYNPGLDAKMHPRFGLANMGLTAELLMIRLLGKHMTFEDE
jgi:hypothetical protein